MHNVVRNTIHTYSTQNDHRGFSKTRQKPTNNFQNNHFFFFSEIICIWCWGFMFHLTSIRSSQERASHTFISLVSESWDVEYGKFNYKKLDIVVVILRENQKSISLSTSKYDERTSASNWHDVRVHQTCVIDLIFACSMTTLVSFNIYEEREVHIEANNVIIAQRYRSFNSITQSQDRHRVGFVKTNQRYFLVFT